MATNQILVVDDERVVATCIRNELESFGYQVAGIASTAKDAIEKADQFQPDLVLMDIHLKGDMDGIEAAREIHARYGIPIVYLSAFADPETVARAAGTGAFGYLLKPYEEQELKTTIEMALAMHRSECRLAETERWLAAVLEGVDDAVIAADPDHQIRFMNRAAYDLTGWNKDEAVGRPLADVCRLEQQHRPIMLDELADRDACDRCVVAIPDVTHLIGRSGRETPVEGSFSPIFDPRGEFLGTALTLRSVAARLELERTRRHDEEQMRRSQKLEAVRRVAGGMAHHLNNLLTVILGNTSLALSQPSIEQECATVLGHVEAASHRAAELIRGLLVFSGHGQGQLPQVDLNQALPECLDEIKPLLEPWVSVAYKPVADLWPVSVDEVQLGQALLDLYLNVQESLLDGGKLILECHNVVLEEDQLASHQDASVGNFVRMRVRVTGPGMTPEARQRLMGLLLKGLKTRKDENELAFVIEVMEQHHGWIECNGNDEIGTQFDMYFPSCGVHEEVESIAALPPRPQGTRPTILLAESDAMVRSLGQQILEGHGYQVLVADDGVQALEVFRQAPQQVDLAVIDLNLPRLTGDAILGRLLELDPHVEVLFSSGYFSEDHHESGGHVLGVIRKPYSRQDLIALVHRALQRRSENLCQHGRISKISLPDGPDHPETGCGFISTCDGRDIYFHCSSLVDLTLMRLELGSEVGFDEEMSETGPRAKLVRPLSRQPHLVD